MHTAPFPIHEPANGTDQPTQTPPPPAGGAAGAAGVLIPTRSEKQAMEWSLALASQHIACVIRPPGAGKPWGLEVDTADTGTALRTLRQYHVENRRWREAFAPAPGALPFHWAVLPWCLLMLVVAWAAAAPGSRLAARGAFITSATATGDLWRPLTATFLHAGIDHLAANLATGFVLIGLAMGRYGVGIALLGTLAAGVGGNLLAWLWRGHDYTGLGSSGVVMAALGMLTVSLVADTRALRVPPATLLRGVFGGVALFILLGTSPNSDVLAHAGGFLCGVAGAALLSTLPTRWSTHRGLDLAAGTAYFAAGALGWLAALH